MEIPLNILQWLGARLHKSFIAPLTESWWPVAAALGLTVLFLGFEAFLMGWRGSAFRRLLRPGPSARGDLFLYLAGELRLLPILIAVSCFGLPNLVTAVAWKTSHLNLLSRIENPLLQHLLYFVVFDFLMYWVHYLQHRVPFLWELHKFHHSAEEMNLITVDRSHPMEKALMAVMLALPMAILGVPASSFLLIVVVNRFLAQLHHSNFPWRFGWLGRWVFVSPHHHRIHHSVDPVHWDRNFAGQLVIFDRLFRTRYEGEVEPRAFGVDGGEYNRGLLSDMLAPYRAYARWVKGRLQQRGQGPQPGAVDTSPH